MSTNTSGYSVYALMIPKSYEEDFITRLNGEADQEDPVDTFEDLNGWYSFGDIPDTILVANDECHPTMQRLDNTFFTKEILRDALIVPLRRQPELFTKVYESVHDIVAEMKEDVGPYLPTDFPYEDFIGLYSEVFKG